MRELSDVFVIGQECPKVEVPAPNSKIANQFQKELLQVNLLPCPLSRLNCSGTKRLFFF